MSRAKMDQTFPHESALQTDAKFARLIASTLRAEYGELSSAVKELAIDARVHPRTARNWYEGNNLIKSRHLILLAQRSAAINKLLIEILVAETKIQDGKQSIFVTDQAEFSSPPAWNGAKNVPINVPIKSERASLNARQEWFLDQILNTTATSAGGIAHAWNVTPKTAKRDIADLQQRGIITRVGSRKSGRYAVVPLDKETLSPNPVILSKNNPCS